MMHLLQKSLWGCLRPACGVVMLAVVASCSGAATPTPSPTPTPEPPPQGILRVAAVGAPEEPDLHRHVSEWATLFGPGLAYSRLLRFKSGPEVHLPSMEVECDLCEEWRQVTLLVYEFGLPTDARWQSAEPFPGRPVTAQDVVFSLERLRTPGWLHASLLASVGEITAVDGHTVRLVLHYPDPDLPRQLANPHAVIMAPEMVQPEVAQQGAVVGTGPWLWGRSGFTAFDAYFRPGVPGVGGLRIVPVPDQAAASAVLAAGRVDVAPVTEEAWPSLEAAGFGSRLVPRQGVGLVLALNAGSPPLDEPEVRRALLLALDPYAALEQGWDGLGRVGVGVPVVEPGWLLDDEEVQAHFSQPRQAQELLADALGTPVPLRLTVANFGPRYTAYGQLIAGQLRAAGFQVSVEVLSRSSYLTTVWEERDFQVFVGPLPPVITTNSFLLSLLHSSGQWHITNHSDQELDWLIEEQSAEMAPAQRGDLVRQIQRRVLEQGLLFMPVMRVERWAFSPRVAGFHPNMAAGDGSFWRWLGLAEEE